MAIPRPIKFSLWTLGILLVLFGAIATTLGVLLMGSRATLDGALTGQDVSAAVIVERDAQGLVTLTGENRNDIAYGLGFVHAQERLFQMDLLRRNSAGELSALFGPIAINVDKAIRKHQFRRRAEDTITQLPESQRALLYAYANGVNAGRAELSQKPFEYLLLQADPTDWSNADTILVVYSMYMDLQDEWGETERSLTALSDFLTEEWFEFLVPLGGEWDATLDGGDVEFTAAFPTTPLSDFEPETSALSQYRYEDEILAGSNNWSVGGALTDTGSALVADDMHLGLDVPNIWFRASWYDPLDQRRITGATLPGAPLMIVGSNEHIAWGFTNTYGDYMDVIRLQTNAEASEYLTEDGWEAFETPTEIINVKGEQAQSIQVKNTRWGPVIGEDHFGNLLALRWVAHDAEGYKLGLLDLERANTVDEALAIAKGTGVPGQNMTVGDKEGNIGWTIMGRLPERFGFESGLKERLTADWSDGERGWAGYLPPGDYPSVVNPDSERIWTANARMVSDDDYRTMGDNIGALGARQQQIRDRLFEQSSFNEGAFLAIQLDDEARFLSRWHSHLVALMANEAIADDAAFDAFRTALDDWTGNASKDSVAYRLVKRYREEVIDQTVGLLFESVAQKTEDFWPGTVDNRVEYAVWKLINEQPERHLPSRWSSWDQLLIFAAETVRVNLSDENGSLANATWGEQNRLSIQHPLSRAIPALSLFLDMDNTAMSGDTFMPRVQGTTFGASQRLAVSPGYEENGYFHMATGQSGHPLSPFYRAGHDNWVEGRPSPFLPGDTQYELTLAP